MSENRYRIGQIPLSNDWYVNDNKAGRYVFLAKDEAEAKEWLRQLVVKEEATQLVNELADTYSTWAKENGADPLSINLTGMRDAILNRVRNSKISDHTFTMDKGCLVMDGRIIDRFAEEDKTMNGAFIRSDAHEFENEDMVLDEYDRD